MVTRPTIRLLVLVPVIVIALDQLTKYLVMANLPLSETRLLINGLLAITHVRNPGAAFGLFAHAGEGFRTAFLVGVSILAVVLLSVYYLKTHAADRWGRAAALLVIGGALGNLIDRVRFGYVVDFVDVYVGPPLWPSSVQVFFAQKVGATHWPAFNVADAAISIGVALFLWSAWQGRGQTDESVPEAAPRKGEA